MLLSLKGLRIHHSILVLREISEQVFSECGLPFKQDGEFDECDITEDDPRWVYVSAAISRYQQITDALRGFSIPGSNSGDRVWMEFLDEGRRRAPFCEMGAWYYGYPQPEEMNLAASTGADKFPYLRRTYDFSEACVTCWRGKRQIAPFRMKKSPAWGRRSILQMNWLHEEFFVKPEVYAARAFFVRLE
jgi:hypothetical protein